MTDESRINVEALLAGIDLVGVVQQRTKLKRMGREYRGPCPFHEGGANSTSFVVVPSKGFYHCFVCQENGNAIDWTRHFTGLGFVEACKMLGSGLASPGNGWTPPPEPPARITKAPPPGEEPPSITSRHWGEPVRRWVYRSPAGATLFAVDRYEYVDDGEAKKVTPQITYGSRDEGATWRWGFGHWQGPRPLYGLEILAQHPERQVLIVEGEKAAEAARTLLPSQVVLTWAGGGGAIDAADWTPLAGRDVILWPDADSQTYKTGDLAGQVKPYVEQPGVVTMTRLAAILTPIAKRVRLVSVEGQADGWDAADALADGWTSDTTRTWLLPRIGPITAPAVTEPPPPVTPITRGPLTLTSGGPEPVPPPDEDPDEDGRPQFAAGWWSALGLACTSKGVPHQNLDNVVRVLEGHPDLTGRIWWDRFYRRAFTTAAPLGGRSDAHELSDSDVLMLTVWIQRVIGLTKVTDSLVGRAVQAVAARNSRSEPEDWLRGLVWDQVRRLPTMMMRYFGAGQSEYSEAVGVNFMRGMVARVLFPGCQMDNMVILEGKQGTYKSQALRALGGKWFAESRHSVDHQNFYTTLHGKMLVDMAELASAATADVRKFKQALSVTVDRFRMPYAHRDEDYPRSNVFVASTNEVDTLRDPTGARRFWPIRCSVIDPQAIVADRDQLFAEAVADVLAGEKWHVMPEEATRREQARRRQVDAWEPMIVRWVTCYRQSSPDTGSVWLPRDTPLSAVSVGDILLFALDVPLPRWGRVEQQRVAAALHGMGWVAEDGSQGQRFVNPNPSAPEGPPPPDEPPPDWGQGDAFEEP